MYNIFNLASDFDQDMVSILIMVFFAIIVVSLIISLMSIIGRWKLFKKAGKSGWEALIPIYNTYVTCQITGVNPLWIAIFYGGALITAFVPFLGFIYTIVSIYFPVLLAISTAKSFGKDDIYGIGLFFLEPIFILILGCGSSQYVGPMPMNDAIFEMFGIKNDAVNQNVNNGSSNVHVTNMNVNSAQSVDSMANVRYCSACGSRVMDGSLYCANCGHKI